MSCVIIGDSIGVGVARHRTECISQAHVSQNTAQTVKLLSKMLGDTDQVLISVGSNDVMGQSDVSHWVAEYRKLRAGINSGCVVWLLPNNKENARAAITIVAQQHGDAVLDTRPFTSADLVHPTSSGYQRLAQLSRLSTCN